MRWRVGDASERADAEDAEGLVARSEGVFGKNVDAAQRPAVVAAPPLAGIVHSVPSRSIAMVRPSGDNAAAIDVPSWRVTWT